MTYLIDSDIVIDALFARADARQLIIELRRHGISLSVISYLEIVEGVEAGATPHRARLGLRSFLRGTRMLVVSRPIAERAAAIRLDLRRQRRQVHERALDILVAATAIEHGLVLVTRNTRDYADIPGLQLYQRT
jgi:tRNA(fMet)-specific endonuclease VapC